MSVAAAFSLWQGAHALSANAVVTLVADSRPSEHYGKYLVDFTTADGTTCTSSVISPEIKRIGDTIEVRYNSHLPCDNLHAAADRTWWGFAPIAPALALATLIAILLVRRRGRS